MEVSSKHLLGNIYTEKKQLAVLKHFMLDPAFICLFIFSKFNKKGIFNQVTRMKKV